MIRLAAGIGLAGMILALYGRLIAHDDRIMLIAIGLSALSVGIFATNIRDAWKDNGE